MTKLFDPKLGFKPVTSLQSQLFAKYYPLSPEPPSFENHPRWIALIGDPATGKTISGVVWTILQALWFPRHRGLIVVGLEDLTQLVTVCKLYDIPLEPNLESVEYTAKLIRAKRCCYIGTDRAFVWVYSPNDFAKSGRAQLIRYMWIDESALTPDQLEFERIFLMLDNRLRVKGLDFCCGLVTSSNDFKWTHPKYYENNSDRLIINM